VGPPSVAAADGDSESAAVEVGPVVSVGLMVSSGRHLMLSRMSRHSCPPDAWREAHLAHL
jgi:hypothetical protein